MVREMSDVKQRKSKNIVIVPEATVETVRPDDSESEQSEPEVIELTPADRPHRGGKGEVSPHHDKKSKVSVPVETKTTAEKKKEGLAKARAVLQERRQKQREEDEKAKELIQKAYEKEVEASLIKTSLPKYSRQIKKQILEKLKQKKLAELKKTYGYESSDSESDSEEESSESEEEEVVVVKSKKKAVVQVPKKEVKQPVKVSKPVEVQKPLGIIDRMRSFGF